VRRVKKIKLAIIDDGVNEKFAAGIQLDADYEVVDGIVNERKVRDLYQRSHGTDCATILCNHTKNYQLYSIKILDDQRTANKKDLITALEWCLNNGVELVNLSIGSSYYKDYADLKMIIDHLLSKGVIIVAACDNRNIRTFPASFPGVIGVRTDRVGILKEKEYVFIDNPGDGIDIIAYSEFTVRYSNGEQKQLSANNSYAAPYITALVCNYLSRHPLNIESIRRHLKIGGVCKDVTAYDYVKANMLLWQDKVEAPIIAVIHREIDSPSHLNLVSQLAAYFREDGYCCIACIDDCVPDNLPYIFDIQRYFEAVNLDFHSKLRLLYNVELPDLLILSMSKSKFSYLRKIHDNDGIDIIICIHDENLYRQLRRTDAPCDKAFLSVDKKPKFFQGIFDKNIYPLGDHQKLYINIKRIYDMKR
jgi:hypothetical protein